MISEKKIIIHKDVNVYLDDWDFLAERGEILSEIVREFLNNRVKVIKAKEAAATQEALGIEPTELNAIDVITKEQIWNMEIGTPRYPETFAEFIKELRQDIAEEKILNPKYEYPLIYDMNTRLRDIIAKKLGMSTSPNTLDSAIMSTFELRRWIDGEYKAHEVTTGVIITPVVTGA